MSEKTIAEQIADATEGLKSKNKELIQELKDSKSMLSKFDGIDVDALTKSHKELAKIKKEKDESEGNYKKLYETQKTQHETESMSLKELAASAKLDLHKERTSNSLTRALAENHVDPVLLDSAALILSNDVVVDDKGVPMVGDKSVNDFVKDWTSSDVGKRFVTPENSGGGATGPGGKADVNAPFYDPNSPKYNLTEQARIATSDPAAHKALKSGAPAKK